MGSQLFLLALLLLAAPAVIGGLFYKVDKLAENLFFRWIGGQFLLWAGFQLICVPLILKGESFSRLVQLFSGYLAALVLLAAAVEIQRLVKGKRVLRFPGKKKSSGGNGASGVLLWTLFWGALLFQLVQAVRLSYADTDDAFYVAISSITQESDTMYQVLPYTGGATQLDARHGLAPFPIWISFLGRTTGMPAVTVAKVVLPVVLIAMAYAVCYLFARILFPENGRQRALFLIFAELLVLFGNQSIYTAENFLIARSRQGKAALGSIVIPFLLFCLLLLLKKIQQKERIQVSFYFLMGAVAMTGCLCSTLGALLMCMALGIAGLLGAVCYKRLPVLFPLAACCVPCVVFAFLYLVID
ncbi:MAG TPA: hypothetical protein DCZ91_13300 [Lachnospiraceae bacterium]|nr:hypothetical protein [Lachnospiraceae bacterium]